MLGAPGGVSAKPGQELARIAMAVGLPATATGRDIVLHIAAARNRAPIPPKILATDPCKENIVTGDAIAIQRDWRKTHPNMTSSELFQEIGNALLKTKAGMGMPKYIVVNDDIDLTNTKEVV